VPRRPYNWFNFHDFWNEDPSRRGDARPAGPPRSPGWLLLGGASSLPAHAQAFDLKALMQRWRSASRARRASPRSASSAASTAR
jgi:hypothetical protein